MKACRECHRIVEGNICPVCKMAHLTDDWSGLIIIFDIESELAKSLNITHPGRYALRVR
ncbi:MAG: DNA-directed RNA polymerase, subunit E'' [Theionarchaea archaeon]|nr:DNA-directed RNA polymerase, subunit E'' [Theionarchaea archaeon]